MRVLYITIIAAVLATSALASRYGEEDAVYQGEPACTGFIIKFMCHFRCKRNNNFTGNEWGILLYTSVANSHVKQEIQPIEYVLKLSSLFLSELLGQAAEKLCIKIIMYTS